MEPQDRRYTKDHEWVKIEGDRGRVGITDYAQRQLGDVVFVDLPEVGSALVAGKQFGAVESVKAVSELYSPVSGTVVEVHSGTPPQTVNSDPYGEGWMIVVTLDTPAELSALMDAAEYEAHVAREAK